jgi:3-oxoacyl-[acyl-carrier protein] reductase
LADLPAPSALVHAASPPIAAPLEQLFDVTYAALRDLTESLVGGMLRRQHGRVLFIGSSAVDHAQPGWEDYTAAKQAASGYVRAFDGRYSPYGLFGAVVAPGFVLSDFSQAFRPEDAECLLPEETAEAIVEELEAADRRQGGYLQLAPGLKRRGEFGFHQHNGEAEREARALSNCESAGAEPFGAGVSPASPLTERGSRGLSNGDSADHWGIASLCRQPPKAGVVLREIVRSFFRLPNETSLAEAGLGVTPGWDSLGHLELLLHLESTLGLSFTSSELSRTGPCPRNGFAATRT